MEWCKCASYHPSYHPHAIPSYHPHASQLLTARDLLKLVESQFTGKEIFPEVERVVLSPAVASLSAGITIAVAGITTAAGITATPAPAASIASIAATVATRT